MIARLVSTRPVRSRVGATAALLLGAALLGAQSAGAQVEPADGAIVGAPGAGFDYVDLGAVAPAPAHEYATVVPALPWLPSDIQPAPGDVQPGW